MVFGMSLQSFTAIHVAISLIGILSGLIVLAGMFSGQAHERPDRAVSGNHRVNQHFWLRIPVRQSYAG